MTKQHPEIWSVLFHQPQHKCEHDKFNFGNRISYSGNKQKQLYLSRAVCPQGGSTSNPPAAGAQCTAAFCHGTQLL